MKRFEAQTNDDIAGFVYSTTNYDQFSLSDLNRSISKSHVKKLVKELKYNPEMPLPPIEVAPDFSIVDGQHRFTALKECHLPVYYQVDNWLSINDTIEINANQVAMKAADYIKIQSKRGNKNYIGLSNMIKKYGRVGSIASIAAIFYRPGINKKNNICATSGGSTSQKIKSGKYHFDYDNQFEKENFMIFLENLKDKKKLRGRMPTISALAIADWYFNPKVSRDRLFKVLNAELLQQMNRSRDFSKKVIAAEYNYGLSTNRIKFTYYEDSQGYHFEFIN